MSLPRSPPPPVPDTPPCDWAGLADWLAQWYPEVPTLPVDALAAWLDDGARAPPLLLDHRSVDEQAVSTLPSACCVPTEADARRALAGVAADDPIVVYCAVGVRSARLARALRLAGYTAVFNLEGSIFAWANRGLPLMRGGAATLQVHPYDERWGALLAPQRRSLTADAIRRA